MWEAVTIVSPLRKKWKFKFKIQWPCLCSHLHLSVMCGFPKSPTEDLSFFSFSREICALGEGAFPGCDLCHCAHFWTEQHAIRNSSQKREEGAVLSLMECLSLCQRGGAWRSFLLAVPFHPVKDLSTWGGFRWQKRR